MLYRLSKIALIVSVLLFAAFAGVAQQKTSRLEQLKKINAPAPKSNYSSYLKKSSNELELTAAVLFVGYKEFVSSQDMASCVFTPSCSVYAIESLQSDPLPVAYFKIFDRLSRCHPLTAKGQYPIDRKSLQLYDPVH